MKITAGDLLKLGIIERIIPEHEPGNSENLGEIALEMDKEIGRFLSEYGKKSSTELQEQRYNRFRVI